LCVNKNKPVFGISLNFNAGLVYLFGPKNNGPAFFEKTGSVIITLSPNLIKKVECPIQAI